MSPLTGTTLLIRLARPDGTLGGEKKKKKRDRRREEREEEQEEGEVAES